MDQSTQWHTCANCASFANWLNAAPGEEEGGKRGGEGPFKIKVTCKNVNRLVEATRERCYLLLALLLGSAVYDNDCYICGPQFQRNM